MPRLNKSQQHKACTTLAAALRDVVRARQHAVWVSMRMQFPPASRVPKVIALRNVLSRAVLRAGFQQMCATQRPAVEVHNSVGILWRYWCRWRMCAHDRKVAHEHACNTLFRTVRGVHNKLLLLGMDRWKRLLVDEQTSSRADVEEVISLARQCWIGLAPRNIENPQAPDLYQTVLLRTIVRRKRLKTLSMAVHRWIFQLDRNDPIEPADTTSACAQTDEIQAPVEPLEEPVVHRLQCIGEHECLSVHQPSIESDGHAMLRCSQTSSSTGKSYFSSIERLVERASLTHVASELQSCFFAWRQEALSHVLQLRLACQKLGAVCDVVILGSLYTAMGKLAGARWEGLHHRSRSAIEQMESVHDDLQQKVGILEKEHKSVLDRARLSQSITRAQLSRINIDALRSGTVLVKFQWMKSFRAPRGQRCRKMFTVHVPSQSECHLAWSSHVEEGRRKQFLRECQGVSHSYRDQWKFSLDDKKSLCFILIGKERDVELCTTSLADFLNWFLGLQYLCQVHGTAKCTMTRQLLLARYIRRKLTPRQGKDSRRRYCQMWMDAIGITLSQIAN